MWRLWGATAFGLVLLGLCACRPAEPRIRVEDAWVRVTVDRGAAYMTIFNDGGAGDVLVGASSKVADSVSLHRTVAKGNMMGMEPVLRLEVLAGDRVELKPLGLHFMLMELQKNLELGQRVRITLIFETSGEVEVEAEVRQE